MSEDDSFAARLRRFGPVGLSAMLLVVAASLVGGWAAAIFILLWVRLSRTSWSALGLARPDGWAVPGILGVTFGAAFKLLQKSVLLPLLGVPPVNSAYHYLVGNPSALPGMILVILVSAAFGEELFYRGYLFERIGALLGSSRGAKVFAVLLTAIWFGLAHLLGQGKPGAIQGVLVGLVFGGIFAATGRLWILMFAHAAFDLTALALIYFGLEARVAHWFFR